MSAEGWIATAAVASTLVTAAVALWTSRRARQANIAATFTAHVLARLEQVEEEARDMRAREARMRARLDVLEERAERHRTWRRVVLDYVHALIAALRRASIDPPEPPAGLHDDI